MAIDAGSFGFAQAGPRHAAESEGLGDDALEDKESLASLFFGQVANQGHIWPWFAFRSKMIQTINAPNATSMCKGPVIKIKNGMKVKIESRTWMANTATQKKMLWKEWNRTNRLWLYGAVTRKMIAGMKVT